MSRAIDPFDELAALFLTEPEAPSHGTGMHQRAMVELLLVGHLPVRAGLWLAPYADTVARDLGPTVLLRLDDAAPHLQLLRASPDDLQNLSQPASLRQVIRALMPTVRRWVVRPGSDADPVELVVGGADRLTILSGADQAARVAAYTLIKSLVQAAEECAGPMPSLAMAVLGCDEHTARNVVEGLNRTASSFLGASTAGVYLPPSSPGHETPAGALARHPELLDGDQTLVQGTIARTSKPTRRRHGKMTS